MFQKNHGCHDSLQRVKYPFLYLCGNNYLHVMIVVMLATKIISPFKFPVQLGFGNISKQILAGSPRTAVILVIPISLFSEKLQQSSEKLTNGCRAVLKSKSKLMTQKAIYLN